MKQIIATALCTILLVVVYENSSSLYQKQTISSTETSVHLKTIMKTSNVNDSEKAKLDPEIVNFLEKYRWEFVVDKNGDHFWKDPTTGQQYIALWAVNKQLIRVCSSPTDHGR